MAKTNGRARRTAKKKTAKPKRKPRKRKSVGHTVSTQSDVASFFGVSINTVLLWGKQGMPGSRGNWPLDQIVKWLRADGPWKQRWTPDDETGEIKGRIARLQLQRDEQGLRKDLGQLADIDAVARLVRRCIANSKAVMEPLADQLCQAVTVDDRTREVIREIAERMTRGAYQQLAEMAAGDTDETEDSEDS